MRAYYLNLDQSTSRRLSIEKGFSRYNIELLRIAAARPEDVPHQFRAPQSLKSDYDRRTAGCSYSHMLAWEKIKDQEKRGAFVFEDDIIPRQKFTRNMEKLKASGALDVYDIIFVNRRMSHWVTLADEIKQYPEAVVPISELLYIFNGKYPIGGRNNGSYLPHVGGDSYWLSQTGAMKLAEIGWSFCKPSNVDWLMCSISAHFVPAELRIHKMNELLIKEGLAEYALFSDAKYSPLIGGAFRDGLTTMEKNLPSTRNT